eukprot:TRINITY_DN2673_c0_g1_i2.p1 TRINITY_DN2673_c0_g1~~TRINITY_DN2673_c0_g1_i2.p1  ORF type:complete len:132 (-),score=23.19 TRINITY_DN2673_c0_g1_i2:260-604(-)
MAAETSTDQVMVVRVVPDLSFNDELWRADDPRFAPTHPDVLVSKVVSRATGFDVAIFVDRTRPSQQNNRVATFYSLDADPGFGTMQDCPFEIVLMRPDRRHWSLDEAASVWSFL